MEMYIDGIRVEVERRRVRNMRLTVYADGRVSMVVPWLTTAGAAREFLFSKREWLQKHYESMMSRPKKQEPEYVTGERLLVFGRETELRVETTSGRSQGVVRMGDKVVMYCHSGADRAKREALIEEFYRNELYKYIRRRLGEYCEQYGEEEVGFRIRRMKTEWGSCTAQKRSMLFNLRLGTVPEELIDYVIVHEMCHLRVQNHSEQFWRLVESRMPDYRERKKALSRY